MSESAATALGQGFGIWNRNLYTKLIDYLKAERAKAIFFDLVLADPYDAMLSDLDLKDSAYEGLRGSFRKIDDQLHEAIGRHGQVYFGAMFDAQERTVGGFDVSLQTMKVPHDALMEALGGEEGHWGLLAFNPIDSDYTVRRYYGGTLYVKSATWVLANEMGAGLGGDWEERNRPRWLNYYGPPESVSRDGKHREFTFDSVDYDTALLHPEQVPKEFFRDKIVFIGQRTQLGTVNVGKDEFRHPISRWTGRYSTGVEVHATAFLNLLKHEWLSRFDWRWELPLIVLFGVLLTIVSTRVVPSVAVVIALLAVVALVSLGFWSQLDRRVWFNWSFPVITQVPLALMWGLINRYGVVERRRRRIRFLLNKYLSADVAAAMVDHGFRLMPSTHCVVTIMFTDIEGFTTLSQKLTPADVARVLTAYFQRTNPHIHKNSGAILRYVGDAIVAVWNAPRECADHTERACAAAHQIALLNTEPLRVDDTPFLVDGLPLKLRTRIGVHTGNVLACNIGDDERFDFTVLGDEVNLAARLEGLNKYFGTIALTTRPSIRRCAKSVGVRCLGTIVVKGRSKGVRVFELSGGTISEEWQRRFFRTVVLFAKGQIAAAEAEFRALKGERPDDGPIAFYLERIASGKVAWPLHMEDK